jgi:hypothetical protein
MPDDDPCLQVDDRLQRNPKGVDKAQERHSARVDICTACWLLPCVGDFLYLISTKPACIDLLLPMSRKSAVLMSTGAS